MPWFDKLFTKENSFEIVGKGSFYQGSELLNYTVLKESTDMLGFPLYLIKIPHKLDREEVYCYPDEAEQWIAFQHAFLNWIKYEKGAPNIVHCHDHHVGLIPFLIKYANEFNDLSETVKTVFTVHNGQYQGWMGWNKSILLPAFDTWKWGLLDWDGVINPLATAIKCCDAYTAVSEGYLKELFVEANGLQNLFRDEAGKAHGIVNGIDPLYWNPKLDPLISFNYGTSTATRGKQANKKVLCKEYGLPADVPLLSFIGRFAAEKGADKLGEIIRKLFSQNKYKIAIFILGSGDRGIEAEMGVLKETYADNLATYIGYNEALAHEVYAASDMLLMPSRVEPCGLNQLYALQYGTVPIVRGIGGLKDTVKDNSETGGYGFVFEHLDSSEAVDTIIRALEIYQDTKQWRAIRKRAMQLDFSWESSARKYLDLYDQL
jgi:starch synthase